MKPLLTTLFLSFFLTKTQAQPKIYVVHPSVGDTIDSEELKRYKLVQDTNAPSAIVFTQFTSSRFHHHQLKGNQWIHSEMDSDSIVRLKKWVSNIDAYHHFEIEKTQDQLLVFELTTGKQMTGKVQFQNEQLIILIDEKGKSKTIEPRNISAINKPYDSEFLERQNQSDPNYTRLLFSHNSRLLQKGEGYLNGHFLFFLGAGYGLSNHINIHAGTTFVPTASLNEQIKMISLRGGGTINPNIHLSTGVTGIFGKNGYGLYMPYASASFGPPKILITISYAMGFANSEEYGLTSANINLFSLGANIQLSKSFALVGDNWLLAGKGRVANENIQMPSLALRYFKNNFAIDAGVWLMFFNIDNWLLGDQTIGFPWLSATYCFSTKKGLKPD